MLKIEDGCVNFCSYCIIPYARGRVRSLSPQDTRRELERLLEAGYREIVLTGIEISSWGQDLPGEQTPYRPAGNRLPGPARRGPHPPGQPGAPHHHP